MTDGIAIPGYSILRELGRGGMARVYLAIQHSFEREVALKVMSPLLNSDPTFASRFMREARIVAHIHHSSIVPVFDVGEHEPYHYLSMEYLPGGDLKQRIAQGPCDPKFAVEVCVALSAALELAHRKGFVHRDVKPENILFREDGTPVLTDFGIARAIDRATTLTVAGTLVGTPNYMSPEQVKGLELDGRSDLYALGIVFYEMLTGVVPFSADSTLTAALKHLTEPTPLLPPELAMYQSFLERMTAKSRSERFATGSDVIHALRHLGEAPPPANLTLVRPRPDPQPVVHQRTERIQRPVVKARKKIQARKKIEFSLNGQQRLRSAIAVVTNWDATLRRKLGGTLLSVRGAIQQVQLPSLRLPEVNRRTQSTMVGLGALGILVLAIGLVLYGFEKRAMWTTQIPAEEVAEPLEVEETPPPANRVANPADEMRKAAEERLAAENETFKARVAQLIQRNKRLTRQQLQREEKERADQQKIDDLLAKAQAEYAKGAIFEPPVANAADRYKAILILEPGHSVATAGMKRIASILVAEAEHNQASGELVAANRYIARLRALQPDHPRLAELQANLEQMQAKPVELTRVQQINLRRAERYMAKVEEYLQRRPIDWRIADEATGQYDLAAAAAPQAPGLPYLRERIIVAYATAVRKELNDKEEGRARQAIQYARDRNWFSPELAQLERQMKNGQ